MKVLITGSAGFIGHYLAKRFLDNGHHVYGIDSLLNDKKISIKRNLILKKYKKYKFLKTDLSKNKNFFTNINFDLVVHLAAQPGVRISMEKPFKCIESNILAFTNILEFMRKQKNKTIFYASSSTVYGDEKSNFDEKKITRYPKSIYAMTKISNELMANLYHKEYKINLVGLRFFSIYGRYGRTDMSYFKFLNDIHKKKEINLYGDGSIKRSFTHIDDAIKIIELLTKKFRKKKTFNEIFNVGSNKSIKMSQIIELIKKNFNKSFKVRYLKKKNVDSLIKKLSNKKVLKYINYSPKININYGLSDFINWYENEYLKK